ncbi:hypothetical protein EMEDMD4_1310079 [Sinorhizobium medicae]|uniref:Uncharacterized protein n=1 Tax=Sinorhizobium medicae TaxID=110321 RepID=A0A508WRE9_9HYPH|nr:hypothetical protein EMEDMD4_1310079 [Sinorhizobium medicae]
MLAFPAPQLGPILISSRKAALILLKLQPEIDTERRIMDLLSGDLHHVCCAQKSHPSC